MTVALMMKFSLVLRSYESFKLSLLFTILYWSKICHLSYYSGTSNQGWIQDFDYWWCLAMYVGSHLQIQVLSREASTL